MDIQSKLHKTLDLAQGSHIIAVPQAPSVSDRELMSWLDNNIYKYKEYLTTNRYSYRRIIRSQPALISYKSPRIFLPLMHSEGINWDSFVRSGTQPDLIITPIETHICNTAVTQLPKKFISKIGDIVRFGEHEKLLAFNAEESTQLWASKRGATKAAAYKLFSHKIRVGKIGSISFFGNDPEIKTLFQAKAPSKLKGISIEKLYRGNSEVEIKIEEVTKEQILDGRAFFLYETAVAYVNQNTNKVTTQQFIALGSFIELNSVIRYSKARQFMLSFLNAFDTNLDKLLDPESYKRFIEKHKEQFTLWWNDVAEFINLDTIKQHQLIDQVKETLATDNFIENKALVALNAKSRIKQTKPGKNYLNIVDAINKTKDQQEEILKTQNDLKQNLTQINEELKTIRTDIEMFASLIQRNELLSNELTNKVPVLTQKIEKYKEEAKEITQHFLELNDLEKDAKQQYDQALHNIINSTSAINYRENFLKSGIVIKDLIFKNDETGRVISINDDPSVAVNDKFRLNKLHILTTKPTKIYVDRQERGDNAPVVVGGPYDVKVTIHPSGKPEMVMSLASYNSVFGYQIVGREWYAKPHPHTKKAILRKDIKSLENFITQPHYCCPGEIEGIIKKGMEENNPKIVIQAILSWLSSAYSKDDWGKEWNWFPTLDKIDLTKEIPISTANQLDLNSAIEEMKNKIDAVSTNTSP